MWTKVAKKEWKINERLGDILQEELCMCAGRSVEKKKKKRWNTDIRWSDGKLGSERNWQKASFPSHPSDDLLSI